MSYAACLIHPFSPEAEGAQVPDMYSFPTQTAFMRRVLTVSTPSVTGTNGALGALDFVVQPNLFGTVAFQANATVNNVVTGGSTWYASTLANTGASQPGGNNNASPPVSTAGFSEMGVCAASQVTSTFSRYRVVGWGIRVKSVLPPLNQQGTVFIAKVPALEEFGAYASSGVTAGYWNDYLNYYELPQIDSSGFITTDIIRMQTAMSTEVAHMTLEEGIEVVGSVCSPLAFEWRDGKNVASLTTSGAGAQQGLIITNTAAANVAVLDQDFYRQGGWPAILFTARGLPTNPNVAIFTLEIIFHLEGVPQLGSTVISGGIVPPVNMQILASAIHHAHKMPHFRKIARQARSVWNTIQSVGESAGMNPRNMLAAGAMML